MKLSHVCAKIKGRYQQTLCNVFFTRPIVIRNTVPFVSFTFDDFPRSALLTGGRILKRSLGDIKDLVDQGHELGCHTFDHCHSWETKPRIFEESIIDNKQALKDFSLGVSFQTFSYPISCPRPFTKRRVGKHFVCCRGGGQSFNLGTTDGNYLNAFFIEQSRNDPGSINHLIEQNGRARGWLILATHDVCDNPSPYGCTPALFENIVQCAVQSGARILPIVEVWKAIHANPLTVGNQEGEMRVR